MSASNNDRPSSPSNSPGSPGTLSRRELLAGAGAGAAALLLEQRGVRAQATAPQGQPSSARPIVFAHTIVVNADATQDDVALAV